MDAQDTRIQLARQGVQLEEIAKNVARLVDLSENLARMQERETDRDSKISRLFVKGDEAEKTLSALALNVKGTTSWARGVMAVITAVLLPVSGAVMWEVLHDIPAIDRRVQVIETHQTDHIAGMK